jgi:elongation factor Ts
VDIKATDVKALREKTGAGMMDCKKALVQANGDFAKAEKILKELGLAAAQKRASRATREGRIFSRIRDGKGVLLELTCETDFVAKNKEFLALGETLSELAISKGPGAKPEDFSSQVQDVVGKIKENITLRRLQFMEANANDLILDYIHGEGKIGVMVKFALSDPSLKDNPRVKEVAFDLTLHTAAFAPLFLDRNEVAQSYLKEQQEIFTKQAGKLGKPENVVKGIVQGKMNKHLAEICFVDQPFVKDQNLTVSKVLDALNKEIGGQVQIDEYLYYKAGEELE